MWRAILVNAKLGDIFCGKRNGLSPCGIHDVDFISFALTASSTFKLGVSKSFLSICLDFCFLILILVNGFRLELNFMLFVYDSDSY